MISVAFTTQKTRITLITEAESKTSLSIKYTCTLAQNSLQMRAYFCQMLFYLNQ